MDWVRRQRVQGDMDKRDLVNSKTGLKGPHLKCIHISKDVPTGQYGGEDGQPHLDLCEGMEGSWKTFPGA